MLIIVIIKFVVNDDEFHAAIEFDLNQMKETNPVKNLADKDNSLMIQM